MVVDIFTVKPISDGVGSEDSAPQELTAPPRTLGVGRAEQIGQFLYGILSLQTQAQTDPRGQVGHVLLT